MKLGMEAQESDSCDGSQISSTGRHSDGDSLDLLDEWSQSTLMIEEDDEDEYSLSWKGKALGEEANLPCREDLKKGTLKETKIHVTDYGFNGAKEKSLVYDEFGNITDVGEEKSCNEEIIIDDLICVGEYHFSEESEKMHILRNGQNLHRDEIQNANMALLGDGSDCSTQEIECQLSKTSPNCLVRTLLNSGNENKNILTYKNVNIGKLEQVKNLVQSCENRIDTLNNQSGTLCEQDLDNHMHVQKKNKLTNSQNLIVVMDPKAHSEVCQVSDAQECRKGIDKEPQTLNIEIKEEQPVNKLSGKKQNIELPLSIQARLKALQKLLNSINLTKPWITSDMQKEAKEELVHLQAIFDGTDSNWMDCTKITSLVARMRAAKKEFMVQRNKKGDFHMKQEKKFEEKEENKQRITEITSDLEKKIKSGVLPCDPIVIEKAAGGPTSDSSENSLIKQDANAPATTSSSPQSLGSPTPKALVKTLQALTKAKAKKEPENQSEVLSTSFPSNTVQTAIKNKDSFEGLGRMVSSNVPENVSSSPVGEGLEACFRETWRKSYDDVSRSPLENNSKDMAPEEGRLVKSLNIISKLAIDNRSKMEDGVVADKEDEIEVIFRQKKMESPIVDSTEESEFNIQQITPTAIMCTSEKAMLGNSITKTTPATPKQSTVTTLKSKPVLSKMTNTTTISEPDIPLDKAGTTENTCKTSTTNICKLSIATTTPESTTAKSKPSKSTLRTTISKQTTVLSEIAVLKSPPSTTRPPTISKTTPATSKPTVTIVTCISEPETTTVTLRPDTSTTTFTQTTAPVTVESGTNVTIPSPNKPTSNPNRVISILEPVIITTTTGSDVSKAITATAKQVSFLCKLNSTQTIPESTSVIDTHKPKISTATAELAPMMTSKPVTNTTITEPATPKLSAKTTAPNSKTFTLPISKPNTTTATSKPASSHVQSTVSNSVATTTKSKPDISTLKLSNSTAVSKTCTTSSSKIAEPTPVIDTHKPKISTATAELAPMMTSKPITNTTITEPATPKLSAKTTTPNSKTSILPISKPNTTTATSKPASSHVQNTVSSSVATTPKSKPDISTLKLSNSTAVSKTCTTSSSKIGISISTTPKTPVTPSILTITTHSQISTGVPAPCILSKPMQGTSITTIETTTNTITDLPRVHISTEPSVSKSVGAPILVMIKTVEASNTSIKSSHIKPDPSTTKTNVGQSPFPKVQTTSQPLTTFMHSVTTSKVDQVLSTSGVPQSAGAPFAQQMVVPATCKPVAMTSTSMLNCTPVTVPLVRKTTSKVYNIPSSQVSSVLSVQKSSEVPTTTSTLCVSLVSITKTGTSNKNSSSTTTLNSPDKIKTTSLLTSYTPQCESAEKMVNLPKTSYTYATSHISMTPNSDTTKLSTALQPNSSHFPTVSSVSTITVTTSTSFSKSLSATTSTSIVKPVATNTTATKLLPAITAFTKPSQVATTTQSFTAEPIAAAVSKTNKLMPIVKPLPATPKFIPTTSTTIKSLLSVATTASTTFQSTVTITKPLPVTTTPARPLLTDISTSRSISTTITKPLVSTATTARALLIPSPTITARQLSTPTTTTAKPLPIPPVTTTATFVPTSPTITTAKPPQTPATNTVAKQSTPATITTANPLPTPATTNTKCLPSHTTTTTTTVKPLPTTTSPTSKFLTAAPATNTIPQPPAVSTVTSLSMKPKQSTMEHLTPATYTTLTTASSASVICEQIPSTKSEKEPKNDEGNEKVECEETTNCDLNTACQSSTQENRNDSSVELTDDGFRTPIQMSFTPKSKKIVIKFHSFSTEAQKKGNEGIQQKELEQQYLHHNIAEKSKVGLTKDKKCVEKLRYGKENTQTFGNTSAVNAKQDSTRFSNKSNLITNEAADTKNLETSEPPSKKLCLEKIAPPQPQKMPTTNKRKVKDTADGGNKRKKSKSNKVSCDSERERESKKPWVVSSLEQLHQLKEFLGPYSGQVGVILAHISHSYQDTHSRVIHSYDSKEKWGPLLQPEVQRLLELALRRLSTWLLSGRIPQEQMQSTRQAIREGHKLLQCVQDICKEMYCINLDIPALSKALLGKDTLYMKNVIDLVFQYYGKERKSPEVINNIIIQICSEQLKISSLSQPNCSSKLPIQNSSIQDLQYGSLNTQICVSSEKSNAKSLEIQLPSISVGKELQPQKASASLAKADKKQDQPQKTVVSISNFEKEMEQPQNSPANLQILLSLLPSPRGSPQTTPDKNISSLESNQSNSIRKDLCSTTLQIPSNRAQMPCKNNIEVEFSRDSHRRALASQNVIECGEFLDNDEPEILSSHGLPQNKPVEKNKRLDSPEVEMLYSTLGEDVRNEPHITESIPLGKESHTSKELQAISTHPSTSQRSTQLSLSSVSVTSVSVSSDLSHQGRSPSPKPITVVEDGEDVDTLAVEDVVTLLQNFDELDNTEQECIQEYILRLRGSNPEFLDAVKKAMGDD